MGERAAWTPGARSTQEATLNTPEPDRTPVAAFRSQLGWLLVLLIAAGGIVLAVEVGAWLVFASGALAALAIMGLLTPRQDAVSTSIVRHAESGWSYLRTELARSRRHDRQFTVVVVPNDVWTPPTADPGERAAYGLQAAASVQGLVRRPDRAWVDGSRLHVLLTECGRQQAQAFLERASASMPQVFGDERVKLVVFPDDGITSGALLSGLEPGGDGVSEPGRATSTPGEISAARPEASGEVVRR